MQETNVVQLLQQLRSGEPQEAWAGFLREHSPLLLQVVRHFERDADDAADCFQFVCERLCADRFRRLRQFRPDGPASFPTWLRAVVRNLCLDWRRKESGRRRVFRSVARLSAFDQEVFRRVYEQGASQDEALQLLRTAHADVTPDAVAASVERIENELTPNQRRLLGGRPAPGAARERAAGRDDALLNIPDARPDPEAQAVLHETQDALRGALARLPKRDRLLIRLRFEDELTLEQIARLLDLGNAQRADRQIKDVLARLRADMG